MNATDIAEPSQTVRVQLRLRELILGGELKPGARIAELTLVERLNASRTPIRMALVRLQEEGLLEALPHGGYAVKDFSEADIHDAIELRGTLEGLCARLAAERGVTWLTIASSPPGEQGHVTGAQAKELTASRNAAPAAVLLDHRSAAARAYRATVTPHMFVISADGVLRYMGGIDSIRSTRVEDVPRAEPFLRNAMLAVVEGRPVAQASTQAYGCVIKYVDS